MSQISFHVEINDKPNKLGFHEIRIRMTQNRRHRRFNVGFAIKATEWNAKTEQVSKSHKLYAIINAAIQSKLSEIQAEFLKSVPTKQPLTINQLYQKAKKDILGISFITYFEKFAEKTVNASTKISYLTVLNKLKEFLKNKDLYFVEIDYEFVERFLTHVRASANKANTIHHNFKTLRSIYNHAVKERQFTPSFVSPFYGHEVKKQKVQRKKLDASEIARLENLEVRPGIQKFHAKNFFLLSYYLLGVRSSSMILMKWGNIIGDRCIYDPAKGQSTQNVKINHQAKAILDYYKEQYESKRPSVDDYIFGFMKGHGKLKGVQLAKKISSINSIINNQLANISAELQLDKKITTHVARHSFAYNARIKSGNDIYAVKKALGHGSIVVTEAYFDAEENIDSDNLSDLMFSK